MYVCCVTIQNIFNVFSLKIIQHVFFLGNAAVCRSYVSAATTENERTGAFAGISGSQAIGFIVGPGEYMHICEL